MLLILFIAMVFDIVFGEPKWIYERIKHPVTWMSSLLMSGEITLNNLKNSKFKRKSLGLIWILFCLLFCISIGYIIQSYLFKVDQYGILLALVVSVFLAFQSLITHVQAVQNALFTDDIDLAKVNVSMIVGRDANVLDQKGIIRASIESLAENFSDGVIAPTFWFIVAGLPGIIGYKMINTADSMIGNRSERFEEFGWASAKIDDVANFIPARLTSFLFVIAGGLFRIGDVKNGISSTLKYHHLHASPNAGWPEATMAGLINIRLGGPRQYANGNNKDNAWLGDGLEVEMGDLNRALKIAKTSWAIVGAMIFIGVIL